MGCAALRVRARFLGGSHGAPARLAEAVIGIAMFYAVLQIVGSIGGFSLAAAGSACIVVGVATAVLVGPPRTRGATVPQSAPSPERRSTAIAIAGGAGVIGAWTTRTAEAFERGTFDPDSITYHLPMAARFVQEGFVTRLHHLAPDGPTAFQVGNSELLHGFGLLLFRHDVLTPVVNLGWLLLAALAAWCVGRPVGLGPHAVLGMLVIAATPLLSSTQGGSAMTDIAAIALLLSAVALFRAADGVAGFAVAGMAAGAAISTKLTVLAMVAVMTLGVLIARRSDRRAALSFLGALVATGSFWFARNLVLVGNPLPTLHLGVGGVRLPAPEIALIDRYGYAVADYLTSRDVWREVFLPGLGYAFGRGWPLLLLAAVAGALATVRHEWTFRTAGIAAIVGLVAYVFTPTTALGEAGHPVLFVANLRYATPALAMGMTLLPTMALQRAGSRGRSIGALALGVLLVLTLLPQEPEASWSRAGTKAGVAAAMLSIVLVAAWIRLRSWTPRRAMAAVAVAAAFGVVLVGLGGWTVQGHYLRARYRTGGQPQGAAFAWAQDVTDARIGFAGFFQQYPLYGPDASNRVEYIGRPTPHRGFTGISTCRAWRRAVNEGHYDYVVTAPPFVSDTDEPRESSWMTGSDAVTEVLHVRLDRVFRIDGALDPDECP
jgi:hypothetical protein